MSIPRLTYRVIVVLPYLLFVFSYKAAHGKDKWTSGS